MNVQYIDIYHAKKEIEALVSEIYGVEGVGLNTNTNVINVYINNENIRYFVLSSLEKQKTGYVVNIINSGGLNFL